MRKGPFANICEGENNKIEKKMVRLEQKKEALASFLLFVFFQRNGETEYGAFAFDGFDVSITTVLARKVLT